MKINALFNKRWIICQVVKDSKNNHFIIICVSCIFILSFYWITVWYMRLKDIKYSILLLKSFSLTEVQNKLSILFLVKKINPEIKNIRKERKKWFLHWKGSIHQRLLRKGSRLLNRRKYERHFYKICRIKIFLFDSFLWSDCWFYF